MSQNPDQLRTQKGRKPGFESEPESTSDIESRKTQVIVRTRPSFGHRKEETLDQSPNPGQLRTQKGRKPGFESEPESTSDTDSRKT